MAPTNSISTRFTLDGAQDAAAQLAQFGAAANGMVASIGNAIKGISSGFSALESGVAKIGAITAVIGGVGTALLEFAKHSAEATNEIGHLATQSGDTIEQMSGLIGSLSTMGANTENLATAFKRLSVQIETIWPEIKKSVKDAADSVINDQQKIIQSSLAVESAQLALFNARARLATLTGHPFDPEILKAQEIKAAMLAVSEAEARLAETIQKRAEAAKKADEDQKNSIQTVAAAVKSVTDGVAGFQEASAKANLNVDNIIKGLVVNSGPAVAQLGQFRGTIEDLGNQAPKVRDVFLKLADFMKNSGDNALNTAVAFKLFGRGVEQNLIEALSQGSGAIQKNIDRLKELGVVLGESDKHAAEDFRKSINALSFDLSTTSTKIGNLFAPAFSAGFQALATLIENNHQVILSWANDIANRVKPIITDFFNILTGQKVETPWLAAIVSATKAAADGFSRLLPIATLVLTTIGVALTLVAALVNDTFGTKLDAASVAMIAFALRVLPVWASVAVAIGIVIQFMDNLTASSTTTNVALEATGRRLAALKDLLAGNISLKDFKDIWTQIGEDANAAYQKIQKGTTDTGSKINSVFDKVRSDTAANFKKLAEDANASLKDLNGPKTATPAANADSLKPVTAGIKEVSAASKEAQERIALAAQEIKLISAAPFTALKDGIQSTDGPLIRSVGGINDLKDGLQTVGGTLGAAKVIGVGKAFGQVALDAQKAAENVDNLDQELGQVKLDPAAEIDLAAPFEKAKDESLTLWQTIADKWNISPIDAQKLNIDGQFVEIFGNIVTKAQETWDRVKQIFSQQLPAPGGVGVGAGGGGGGGEGFAGGGTVRGPGSSTSDSIWARLSDGEFVMRAAAVQRYGVNFMHAINSMRIPHLNLGGLANNIEASFANMIPVPRFANGGLVPALTQGGGKQLVSLPLFLNGKQFSLQGTNDQVKNFTKAAVMSGVASLGVKPRWRR